MKSSMACLLQTFAVLTANVWSMIRMIWIATTNARDQRYCLSGSMMKARKIAPSDQECSEHNAERTPSKIYVCIIPGKTEV